MVKLTTIFKIRIIYKSGYAHDFEVYDFTFNPGQSIKWDAVSDANKPLRIGFDDISAVYQIGHRKVLRWNKG